MRKAIFRGSKPQTAFVNSTYPYPAMVAGFGSGKTEAHVVRIVKLKLKHPGLNVAFYLPTYDLVDLIGIPRFQEILDRLKVKYKVNHSKKHILVRHNKRKGKIIFRTLDKPERIIGYEVADSGVDELDTLKKDKARNCWEKIIGRNRQKKPDGEINTVSVSTTPEGFRFVYEQWGKNPTASYQIIKATTHSNQRNLPADYIDKLKETYPPSLLDAYINGEFVNLTSGSVYGEFDRTLNHSDETVQHGDDLHIGMDFNVRHMSGIVHVYRKGLPIAVDEFTDILDTPSMIVAIKDRYPSRVVTVYPDASGSAGSSTNASESDISLLRDAGFKISAPKANPRVRDRVVSMNAMFCNALGDRRYKVNTDKCQGYTLDLEQQAYNAQGDPDKTSGNDHKPDAAGYFINRMHPAKGRPKVTVR